MLRWDGGERDDWEWLNVEVNGKRLFFKPTKYYQGINGLQTSVRTMREERDSGVDGE